MKNSNVFESIIVAILGSIFLIINIIFLCIGEYGTIEFIPHNIIYGIYIAAVLQTAAIYIYSSKLEGVIKLASVLLPLTGMFLGMYLSMPEEDFVVTGICGYVGYFISYIVCYITILRDL